MKRKILALGLVSLCWLGLAAGESQAFFGLFHCWHCNKYTTQITCRPYNAFTPICWGNLVCDGCCPNPCGAAGGCLPMTMGVPPWACGQACGPMGGGSCASDMGPMAPRAPGGAAPAYTPPMPMPVGPNTTMMYPPMMPMMPMAPNAMAGYPSMPMQMPPNATVGYPSMPPMQMPPNATMGYPSMPPMQMPPNATMGYPSMPPMQMPPNATMMYPPMTPDVAQAAYQPSYYPMPYPNYYAPQYNPYAQQPMPYYWYGAGR